MIQVRLGGGEGHLLFEFLLPPLMHFALHFALAECGERGKMGRGAKVKAGRKVPLLST